MTDWSVRQPPRFREPDEPRFKPCEGDLIYRGTSDLPQIGLGDIEFAVGVWWRRDAEGAIDWTLHRTILVNEWKRLSGKYAPHDVTLEAQFYRALHKAILAEHSNRIEERCAEEAERDG